MDTNLDEDHGLRSMVLDGEEAYEQSDDESGVLPASMLSRALKGGSFMEDAPERPSEDGRRSAESGSLDVDIETFKEDCWRMISNAQEGDGVRGLADMLDEGDGEEDANRIRVAVRTRPMNEREVRLGTLLCVEHLEDGKNLIVRKHRVSKFVL